MKHAFMMLLVVLLCSISGWGQKRIFDLYSSQVEKLYGIEVDSKCCQKRLINLADRIFMTV